jgi:quercetin dioxygenase-like cupin family protein
MTPLDAAKNNQTPFRNREGSIADDRPCQANKIPQPINLDAIERDWAGRGYSYHRFEDPAGQVWRDFVHATNEVITVAKGQLKVTIEGEAFVADVGDEVFIPRGATHSVANTAAGKTVWLFGYD